MELSLFLYSTLFVGVIIGVSRRSFHWTLVLLVFSATFTAGFSVFYNMWHSVFGAIFWWILPSLLVTALFAQEYEKPVTEPKHDEGIEDILFALLLSFFLVFLFKSYSFGWFLSLMMGYVPCSLLLWLVFLWGKRKAFYLLKIPWVVLSFGSLIEEFGLQKELLPFLVVYILIFILWLKFDLARLWRPPRIT